MTYILKKGVENFEVVDGPFAGKKYVRGTAYAEVPPGEKHKFDKIQEKKSAKPKADGPKLKIDS